MFQQDSSGCCTYKLDELYFIFFFIFKQIHNLTGAVMEN